MNKNRYGPYSLGIMALLISTMMSPTFAEVTNIQTDSRSFYNGDQIEFSGTVEKGSVGLVTIVIRDLNDEFVMLTQALINYDDTFDKTVRINEKFSEHGMYNATGFILNMTKGVTTDFGVSLNGIPIIIDEKITEEIENESIIEQAIEEEIIVEKSIESQVEDTIIQTGIADFVDTSKDPQHYIDRYYNEASYKSWFDRNYPELTIEEATGYTDNIQEIKSTVQELIENKIIPEAQASSIVESSPQNNNPEIAQMLLAIVGLGVLFGAVYGVKRKVDDNSKRISINRETIRKKFIHPIIGSNPKDILQARLAKGEITLEEYEKIRLKLY
ncbi:MAG: SHOCT domain-containing protein [Nitrosopumilus sp.]